MRLPRLPLDAHPQLRSPSAIVERGRVLVCDEDAAREGVRSGMRPALARSLAPSVTLLPRAPAREAAALAALACWAGRYTPRLCIVPQAGLLLEIGGCLRLFGGLENLRRKVSDGVREQGYAARVAVATRATAAWWLAQAGEAAQRGEGGKGGKGGEGPCVDRAALPAALDALPLARLADELSPACVARLAGFGVHTLGAARRLPSAGLARRIGMAAVRAMARAYGRTGGDMGDLGDEQVAPYAEFVFPQRFSLSLELPAPAENAVALLFASGRLVQALAGWLAVRQAGMQECVLHLEHRRLPATRLPLRFAEAVREAARITAILRERLATLALVAPVESLTLEAEAIVALPGKSRALFAGESADPEGMPALIERLRARLGEAQVGGLVLQADHRPECATRWAPQGEGGVASPSSPRPLCLLETPQALSEKNGRPQYHDPCPGPLVLLAGPERIESGWWDAGECEGGAESVGDLRRDYFVALSADQRWLWIYRECRASSDRAGWFLHGWFA